MTTLLTPTSVAGSNVPKLGARHAWPGITLGDPAVWPRFMLRAVEGLGSLGERESTTRKALGRTGEIPQRATRAGKAVIYRGDIEALTLTQLRAAEHQLTGAFADPRPQRMDITTPFDPGQAPMFYIAAAMAADVVDEHELVAGKAEFLRPFVIALRMADPRVYIAAEQVVARSVPGGAGLTLPQTLPATVPAGAPAMGEAVCVNAGNAPTDRMAVDMPGPFTAVDLRNDTTSRRLYAPVTVPAGSFVRADFYERKLTLEGQSEITGALDFEQSDWWEADTPALAPGENHLRFVGGQASPPAFTVSFYSANEG